MNDYRHALNTLNSIAAQMPQPWQDQIKMWIRFSIEESHFEIRQHKPFDEEHQAYNLKAAMHELGKVIAEKSNMYPTWEPQKDGTRKMRVSALYFKNEVGG